MARKRGKGRGAGFKGRCGAQIRKRRIYRGKAIPIKPPSSGRRGTAPAVEVGHCEAVGLARAAASSPPGPLARLSPALRALPLPEEEGKSSGLRPYIYAAL